MISTKARHRLAIITICLLLASLAVVSPATEAAQTNLSATPPPLQSYNGLALTPPMGFNNWSRYTCANNAPNEQLFINTAQALIKTGLRHKGYVYLNIDDCWEESSRDANGNLQADPNRFPHGIRWLADYMHAHGLKLGIYEDGGTTTCGGLPGSFGHFQQDANLFAHWGIDYLKLDFCNDLANQFPQYYGKSLAYIAHDVYTQQSNALKNSGRNIVFSASAPAYFTDGTQGFDDVMGWIGSLSNLWRDTIDISTHNDSNKWASVVNNYQGNVILSQYAGPGHWNDPDMLIIGDKGDSGNLGLTLDESKSQLALWAEMASPLLLSTDVAKLSSQQLAIVGNSDIIAVDQDSLGIQASIVQRQGNVDILSRPLANGDRAVAFFNKGDSGVNVSTTVRYFGYYGSGCTYKVKDLWSGSTTQVSSAVSVNVPSHDTAIFRISTRTCCSIISLLPRLPGPFSIIMCRRRP